MSRSCPSSRLASVVGRHAAGLRLGESRREPHRLDADPSACSRSPSRGPAPGHRTWALGRSPILVRRGRGRLHGTRRPRRADREHHRALGRTGSGCDHGDRALRTCPARRRVDRGRRPRRHRARPTGTSTATASRTRRTRRTHLDGQIGDPDRLDADGDRDRLRGAAAAPGSRSRARVDPATVLEPQPARHLGPLHTSSGTGQRHGPELVAAPRRSRRGSRRRRLPWRRRDRLLAGTTASNGQRSTRSRTHRHRRWTRGRGVCASAVRSTGPCR